MSASELAADEDSFWRFHTVELPERIAAGNGALAFADVEWLGSVGLRTPAGSYTYVPTDGSVEVREGEDAADTVIEVDLDSWLGLVCDLDTAPGLLYGGRAEVVRGQPGRFMRWEPGLRALFHGLPVFDPETADLRGLDGGPLDVESSFSLDDLRSDPSEARHFLSTAGYLHVTDVFDEAEIAEMRAEADILEAEARPGDDESWWGRDTAGAEILTRVLRGGSRPRLRALHDDPRVRLVVDTAPEALVARTKTARDAVTVLWKRPSMVEGLADLPWHRDCGMGGHALNCPTTVMSICLAGEGAPAGELRALPGSHTGAYPFIDGTDTRAPRGVSLPVAPGDLSLHYSDVMHASMPPTSDEGPHRISVLMAFVPSTAGHHRGGRHYNDVLLGDEKGQVEHLGHRLDG